MGLTEWDDTPAGKTWWAEWWAADFSWEGLAQKKWRGWDIKPDGAIVEASPPRPLNQPDPRGLRAATLQDYWRSFGVTDADLIPVRPPNHWRGEDTSDWPEDRWPRFTRFHCPYRDGQGEPTSKEAWDDVETKDFAKALAETLAKAKAGHCPFLGQTEPDRRAQWDGIVAPDVPDQEFITLSVRLAANRSHLNISKRWTSSPDWRLQFGRSADFSNTAFSGDANFESAAFAGDADFRSAAFSGNAFFQNAEFSGDADFRSAKFLQDADFQSAELSGHTLFQGAKFDGEADFKSAKFAREANFKSAEFSEYAVFKSAEFSGIANFENATFPGRSDFDNAAFSRDAKFDGAAFVGYADFKNAEFSVDAKFPNVAFLGIADFWGATFSGDADFQSAAFSKDANFQSATFAGSTKFQKALFLSSADFSGDGAQMTAPAAETTIALDRANERLTGKATTGAQLTPAAKRGIAQADFSGARFEGPAIFDDRDMLGVWDFSRAVFFDRFSLHNSRFHAGFDIEKAVFRTALNPADPAGAIDNDHREQFNRLLAPEMAAWARHNAERAKAVADDEELPEDLKDEMPILTLDGWLEERAEARKARAKPTEANSERHYDLENAFGTLKLGMETLRRRTEEQRFYKLELQARRRRRGDSQVPWWERWISRIFEFTSDFGGSIVRPLFIGLPATLLAFALVYFVSALVVDALHPDQLVSTPVVLGLFKPVHPLLTEALLLSGELIFRPFVIWSPDAASAADTAELLDILLDKPGAIFRLGARLVGTLQSILAIVLIFLTGLAIRRRFQIN